MLMQITFWKLLFSALKNDARRFEMLLQDTIELPAVDHLPLAKQVGAYDVYLESYREKIKRRRSEIEALTKEELAICEGNLSFVFTI